MSVAAFLVTCLEEQASLLNDQIKRAKLMAKMEDTAVVEKVKGKKKKAKADPNKPKKALTAYQLYFMENQGPYKTAHPEITPREVMGEIGKKWSALPLDSKAAYLNAAEEAKKVYEAQMQAYKLTSDNASENPTGDVAAASTSGSSSSASSSSSGSESSDSDSDDEVVEHKPVIPPVITKTKPVKKVPVASVPVVEATPAPAPKSKKVKHTTAATPLVVDVPKLVSTPAPVPSASAPTDTSEKKKKKKKREREES